MRGRLLGEAKSQGVSAFPRDFMNGFTHIRALVELTEDAKLECQAGKPLCPASAQVSVGQVPRNRILFAASVNFLTSSRSFVWLPSFLSVLVFESTPAGCTDWIAWITF